MFDFDYVYNDKKIRDYYQKSENGEEKFWAKHGFVHASAVAEKTGEMLKIFGSDNNEIDAGKIAGILHDIGCIQGKEGHAERGYIMAKEYLSDKKYDENLKNRILYAIKVHSGGDESDEIALALFFADKIDVDKNRLAEEGYKIEGLKEIAYVEKIDFSIDEKLFNLNFYIKKEFNLSNWENYYFYPKIVKAVDMVAKKLKKNGQINYIEIK